MSAALVTGSCQRRSLELQYIRVFKLARAQRPINAEWTNLFLRDRKTRTWNIAD